MSATTQHKALRKLQNEGRKFEVRYAKRQSKCCICKQPIKIGEVVVLSSIDTQLYNAYGPRSWRMEKPCRFCGKDAIEYLTKLRMEVDEAFKRLDAEGLDVAKIAEDFKKGQ
jgi:hypothetical protein